jgi:decaprenylphospho-beta-D-ribofuranose 2-oxidase
MSKPLKTFITFGNAVATTAHCLRPENEEEISAILARSDNLLARGNGSSYGDCCVNQGGLVVDTTRLNHLLSFDPITGQLIAQASVTFADLFAVHPAYIPPVIPGTLKATLAGGIANDVHGKNNHHAGSFGQCVEWVDLQLEQQSLRCSRTENKQLFHATLGGLGLTGIIKRLAINMRKASPFVLVETEKYTSLQTILQRMQYHGIKYDYQVAWLDLHHKSSRGVLSLATHSEFAKLKSRYSFSLPRFPFRLIYDWNMRWFNEYYFHSAPKQKRLLPLTYFNNPLDIVQNWTRLYGKKGLIQFQAVFSQERAEKTISHLFSLIDKANASPALAVLKYFTQTGIGLLSFTQPGFTLAIDFINNHQAHAAIRAMNAYISDIEGKIYLAKDLLLTPEQFRQQYPAHEEFMHLLAHYKSPMRSNLSHRLGITP